MTLILRIAAGVLLIIITVILLKIEDHLHGIETMMSHQRDK